MRRFILSFVALAMLGAFSGCRTVGGICDCYDYGCYPNCYGNCAGSGPKFVTPGSIHQGHNTATVNETATTLPGGLDAKALPSAAPTSGFKTVPQSSPIKKSF
jgi:hypothetical protein